MITRYEPQVIEPKWQQYWEEHQTFAASDDYSKKKFYGLVEFPYPSGKGLHVGHPRPYTAMDVVARKRRMEGYNVLFPIGWDAFGLPTENYAIKTGIHPTIVTHDNIERFRAQIKQLGFSFDYRREVNTTDPSYYKWTQWMFLQFFKKGLAYKAEIPINFCTSCKVGLANEEVVDGVCERCGGTVVQKVRSQWMLRITDYAQELLDGLDELDFIDRVKTQQRNWIGRSEGAEVRFRIADSDRTVTVFTTRPDTLFGATYMVFSPEHPLIAELKDRIQNYADVQAYRDAAAKKSDFERSEMNKDKTGVVLNGVYAVNPCTGQNIPIWVSDYVLMGYGTGAIMAVPAHDERDFAFARKFDLPIVEVVSGGNLPDEPHCACDSGTMVNSGFLNGLEVPAAKAAIIDWLEKEGVGTRKVNYKLRDWVFTRQRYWGEPIPLVHCDQCGWVPLPESELPLELPVLKDFSPTDDGSSCLARAGEWMHTTCPHCGGPAIRETDTMPNWAGSSWYFLRYCDAHNEQVFASEKALKYWMPVDWYNGGMEHTTLHLLYSRFWNRFLHDCGCVPVAEPYLKRTSHGMVLGANGEKMSKSRGNVVNPEDYIPTYGADAFRTYIMFMGAFDQPIPWNEQGTSGCRRFLDRVWRLQDMVKDGEYTSPEMRTALHACIKKVGEDIERMKFNTAIAAMMGLVNDLYAAGSVTANELHTLVLLLSPFAPHMCEQINENMGYPPVTEQAWPAYEQSALQAANVEYGVQINGKIRTRITLPAELDAEGVKQAALGADEVKAAVGDRTVRKVIVVKNIVNIVVA